MAYEVLKTIGNHRYRYRVESYRDQQTGKVKNRWTYVGRADGGSGVQHSRRSSGEQTRERLALAFLGLIERDALDDVTPAAIAREAKVSSATFYRHFRSRDEVIAFCTQRAMNDLNSRLAELKVIASSARDERRRLRQFAADLVRRPSAPAGLFRAWSVLSPEKVREERHTRRIKAFAQYIGELAQRGYIQTPPNVRRLAIALSMIVATFIRSSVLENRLLSEEDYAVVGETFTRLIFLSPV
jgi:AcrR family transcriptional regulator